MIVKYTCLSLFLFILIACSKEENEPEPPVPEPQSKDIKVFLTTRTGIHKLNKQDDLDFSNDLSDLTIRIDTTDIQQEIEGFGAALTGSSAYLIRNMTADGRKTLLQDLFDVENGIGISYLRLCIGSSDFSIGNYTYCDEADIGKFAIPAVDQRDLLPALKEILAINKDIKLMGSPWTAPAWMKANLHLYGGSLKGEEVYNDFAEYFVKYINAYKAEGITIDAISLQNEPHHQISTYPTMYMEWTEQNKIIRNYLGPKFKEAGIGTKILIWDHNFDDYNYAMNILNDAETKEYVAGSAFHGYAGSPNAIEALVKAYPDKSIYFTEQSGGGWNTDDPVGNMLYYMKDYLMATVNRGSKNFLMWNLALDNQHGPTTNTYGGCQNCRGVVTINDSQSYSKNEEYYLIGHFSKFVPPGSHRIGYTVVGAKPSNFEISAFMNPDGTKVVVALNQSGAKKQFIVRTENRKFTYELFDQAVATFIYK